MKKPIPILLLAALLLFVVRAPAKNPSSAPLASTLAETERASTAATAPDADALPRVEVRTQTRAVVAENQQRSGGVETPRTIEDWRRMKAEDPHFEYKTPISFWGRVVDERGTPVAGAEAEIVITDLSTEGTTKVRVFSDVDGLFFLSDRAGKKLSVRVSKNGYRAPQTRNRFSFEYGDLTSPDHFRPDPRRPVVFTLVESAPVASLITREERVAFAPGAPITISGGASGQKVQLRLELMHNEKENAGEWAIRVSAPAGGVRLTTEEFPFEAPEGGFNAELVLDRSTPKPATWPDVYQGGQLYVKSGQLYGIITIKMIPGAKHLTYTLHVNATGSRRLEPRL